MDLEHQELLKYAVPPLAKRFGSTKERAWELLESPNGSFNQLLSQRNDPETRHRVNEWWREYRVDFPALGLGILKRASSPAKLPEPTYNQIICLVWLTDTLCSEQLARELKWKTEVIKPPVILVKPRLTLWQSIFSPFKNLFKKR